MGWLQQFQGRSVLGGGGSGGSWFWRVEPIVLRVVSLGFSLASAYAIRWFFSPLDTGDRIESYITWMVAISFGVLGYFVSRGLTIRLMEHESVWGYLPICLVVEFVEIFCNFAKATSVVQGATWSHTTTGAMHQVLVVLTYAVLSAIPLVSIFLAVVDMDLERKHAQPGSGRKTPGGVWGNGTRQGVRGSAGNGASAQGYAGTWAAQPGGGQRNGTPLAEPRQ